MKKQPRKKVKDTVNLPLIHPDAAGIDIGDTIHAAAVPEGRDEVSVKSFGTMTSDLKEIAAWLSDCKIDTVAMESTGIYWKPLFNVLIKAGFEVFLVNARHARNVSGRKNDEDDARWIQKLHSCGLLKSRYLPEDQQEALRTLVRYRKTLTMDCNRFILRMQKALEMMNIKLHTAIRDITGEYFRSILGVDVTAIFGISDISALEILSETGTNMSKWESSKHFVSWLNLCPNHKISGGKLISSMLMRKKPNPASQAFRNAANAVQRSDNWLGDYFRRMKAKGGKKYAMVATANKIATIYYKMVSQKVEFSPLELNAYQQKYRQAKIAFLERKLHDLKKEAA